MSMLARFAAAAGGRPLPVFVSSSSANANSTSITVPAPSGIQNGDLLVAVVFNNGQGIVTPPAGFNASNLDNALQNTFGIATKVASSESGSYVFSFSVNFAVSVAILVYRNATKVNLLGAITRATSTTGVASSITPTYPGTLCAIFGNESTASITTPPSGFTQRASQVGVAGALAVYDLSNQPSSASASASLVWSASGAVASAQIQVTNEPSVVPAYVSNATKQNASSGTALVINKPAGTADGDLMIAVMTSTSGETWTGDTGWTEIADQGAVPSIRIAYKYAGASEPSSYTFTSSVGGVLSGCIVSYRYATYDTIAGSFTTAANPLILNSITPSASQSLLIAIGARAAASSTLGTPISMTARVTDNDATSGSYIVCDQEVAAGPTGWRSMNVIGATSVAGIMLSIKPNRSL